MQALVDTMLELWNTGSPDAARRLYSSKVTRSDPNFPNGSKSLEDVVKYVAAVHAGFPDFKLAVNQLVGDGNHIVTEWITAGTHTGVFLGIPPTGKFIKVPGASIARIEDGLIVEEHTYFDRMNMLEQLGLASGTQGAQAQRAAT